MNRKTFIESQGATCKNWQWSWSFVNKSAGFVIFGVWDNNETAEGGKILGKDWAKNQNGRSNRGYGQSIEHIELITNHNFKLLTFSQFAKRDSDENIMTDARRISIDKIVPVLERRFMFETEDGWYSTPAPMPPASSYKELIEQDFEEGKEASIIARRAERNPKARRACLEHHGYACKICGLLMSDLYGSVGKDVIEVHHINEMSLCDGVRKVDPKEDLIPVCPNCHTILHTKRPAAYSLDDVRRMLRRNPDNTHERS